MSTGKYPFFSKLPAVYGKVARFPHFFSTLWWMKLRVIPWQSMKMWELVMGERLWDLEYGCDVVCLFDTAESAHLISDRLVRVIIPFGMCFAPSKCKVMYRDWDSPEPPLPMNGVRLNVVDSFTYQSSCLSKDGSIGPEINARMSKARMAFANLLHLWRRNDVSLPVKGRVYNAAVCSVLLYECEKWPFRQQDVHCLEIFYHRCLL